MEKTRTYAGLIKELFMADIFQVKMVNNKKIVDRLGFFSKEGDNREERADDEGFRCGKTVDAVGDQKLEIIPLQTVLGAVAGNQTVVALGAKLFFQ